MNIQKVKALANQDRLAILFSLKTGKKNVREISEISKVAQPTLSQQLTILRNAKMVETTKKGKNVYYTATENTLKAIEHLDQLFC